MEPARLRKLLDQMRDAIASSHYSYRTEEVCYEIRTVQGFLGHNGVKTTMIYTHVLNRDGLGVQSPLDRCSGGRSLVRLVDSPRWHHRSFGAIALNKSPSTICQHHGLTRTRVCPYSC